MKLIIKGDFDELSQFSSIQGLYIVFNQGIELVNSQPEVDGKKEVTFCANVLGIVGKKIKIIRNNKLKTITVILK